VSALPAVPLIAEMITLYLFETSLCAETEVDRIKRMLIKAMRCVVFIVVKLL
jgi:hypothetical protein